jgi:hypothetical protein
LLERDTAAQLHRTAADRSRPDGRGARVDSP